MKYFLPGLTWFCVQFIRRTNTYPALPHTPFSGNHFLSSSAPTPGYRPPLLNACSIRPVQVSSTGHPTKLSDHLAGVLPRRHLRQYWAKDMYIYVHLKYLYSVSLATSFAVHRVEINAMNGRDTNSEMSRRKLVQETDENTSCRNMYQHWCRNWWKTSVVRHLLWKRYFFTSWKLLPLHMDICETK